MKSLLDTLRSDKMQILKNTLFQRHPVEVAILKEEIQLPKQHVFHNPGTFVPTF